MVGRRTQIVKANHTQFLTFLKTSQQFVIPIYQRTYSWTRSECEQLWNDILRAGADDTVTDHFLGSIVYVEQGLYQVTTQAPLLVIDGQQRLATVSLLLEALARRLPKKEPHPRFSADKLRNYYLLNQNEVGQERFKLILTQTDEDTLIAIVEQGRLPADHSLRIQEAFEFFDTRVKGPDSNLEGLCRGLTKLSVIDVALDRHHDNPQLIFESMNSTGLDLSQADLIRNFVLMDLDPEKQTRLYEKHWHPMEVQFGQQAYGKHFNAFMRNYLTLKTGNIPQKNAVYEAFKKHWRQPEITEKGVEALVRDIQIFGDHYCAIALGQEADESLNRTFKDLRELKVDVANPLLLELYDDYTNDILSRDDLAAVTRLIQSYVFRRAICGLPTNSLNKTFSTFSRHVDKEHYLESIEARFQLFRGRQRFPPDEEFKRSFETKDLYNFDRCSYCLRRLEHYDGKERVNVDDFTIEHIMPQNEHLPRIWQHDLGPDWERIRETHLHTIGNLTLTGYNSEYRDKPFTEKRDMKNGFKESPLRLNADLRGLEVWDESAMERRAERMAVLALNVWTIPSLPEETLSVYKPAESTSHDAYSIGDHKNLNEGSKTRKLFDALRTEILALDPSITEDYLKVYIAFKADTNFVDIAPQKKGLKLTLNMPFHDLSDPREAATDVTDIGTWGNGDVSASLTSTDDLPYTMSLIRQSLEHQLGDAAAD